jgi:N-carbamoylputrescine amidase
VLICWDQWYPEAARLTALAAPRSSFTPPPSAGCLRKRPELGAAQHTAWETVQRGHAVANGCYVAAVNRIGMPGDTEFWGQSFVANPYGEIVAKASVEKEELLIVPAICRRWRTSAASGLFSVIAALTPTPL